MTVVKGLWDSWADDAVLDDRSSGRYADPQRVRPINHAGAHYQVKGPLNLPRSPQGRPVFVQAGSSDTGRQFAARHAEAVFTAHLEKATAKAFYTDLKSLVAATGRQADQVLILPGFSPIIGSTEAEARRFSEELNDLSDPEIGRNRLSLAVRRARFLASAARQDPVARGLPRPEQQRSLPQPDRGDRGLCQAGAPDAAAVALQARRRARPFHVRRHAGAGGRSDGGLGRPKASRTAST